MFKNHAKSVQVKIVASFRQYSWSIIPRIIKSLFRRIGIVIETFYLLQYDIDSIEVEKKIKKFDYSCVKKLEVEDLLLLKDFDSAKIELLKKRLLSREYSGYAIWQNDMIVYITWISWANMNYPSLFNLQHTLQTNEALLEDSYCHPDYRGRGFHSMMNFFRINEIKKMGKTTVLALVLKENNPALKVQLKSGFQFKIKICLVKFGTWLKITKKPYHG